MRPLILSIVCAVALAGCTSGYRGTRTVLQKGDVIVFTTPERANQFRIETLNDFKGTSTNVAITRPTTILSE